MYFKPVGGTSHGPHRHLDQSGSAQVNKDQHRDSTERLREVTEHGQERLAERKQKDKEAGQRVHAREIGQLRREIERS